MSDIKINGTLAARSGELFHLPITLSPGQNSTQPVWKDIIVNSATEGGNLPTKHFWYARTPNVPAYDTDGNLTNDGRWTYLWDAENRLIQMETTAAATAAGHSYTKVKAVYDAQGRRLARTVWEGGTAAAPTSETIYRYLYDGWNVVTESEFIATAEAGPTLTRQTTLTWGNDLSNTLQGAGGVGGLLSQSEIVNSQIANHYPSYDGNGNIIAWSQKTSATPIARREYDAFGNTLISEGSWPSSYGFSTKPKDAETGLYYYGYRYYDSATGKWPSRDPIGEKGGLNLYGFVRNDGIGKFDVLGKNLYLASSGPQYVANLGFWIGVIGCGEYKDKITIVTGSPRRVYIRGQIDESSSGYQLTSSESYVQVKIDVQGKGRITINMQALDLDKNGGTYSIDYGTTGLKLTRTQNRHLIEVPNIQLGSLLKYDKNT